ncbi:MAG: TIGR00645 family protein [Proteobacteria bacterium]|nr:TIGR00645 family protein [Pseudomonadota bacterium]
MERLMFASRWLLLPLYLGLILSLGLLTFKFLQKLVSVFPDFIALDFDATIVVSLKLVDITLTGNLLLMVILAGYENFIAPMHNVEESERPSWMGHVDFADLKMKLIAAIVAISAIQLLESFMNIHSEKKDDIMWLIVIHVTFVVSGLLLAVMDRINHPPGDSHK